MRRVVVIGIGNRMMKDDGIGIVVTEFLQNDLESNLESNLEKKVEGERLKIVVAETDAQYCLSLIKEGDFLMIIDATYNGVEPGSISVLPLEKALCNRNKTLSQHEMNLFDLILLYYGTMEGYLIGIEVCEIGFGLGLSNALECKLETICHRIKDSIHKILEEL